MATYTYTTANATIDWALAQAVAEYNAAAGTALTPAQYLAREMDARMQELGRRFARISIADGMARLTPSEFGRIKAARAASPQVDAAVRPIFDSRSVELAGPLWVGGINAMAAAGLLDTPTQARIAALTAPPQPGETVL